jgi:hypothetical protein
MWSKRGTFLLAGMLSLKVSAQVICALGPGAASYKPSADQRPSSDALQLAGRVNAAVKTICGTQCPTMALFRNTTAPNAILIADAGQAKLVYSPQFFGAAFDSFGDAGIIAIIAHELGHALDDTLGAAWIKSSWTPELRADAWAGCLLARLDPAKPDPPRPDSGPGGLQQSLSALSKYSAPSQPGWNLRLPILRAGYIQCGGAGTKFDARK